MSKQVEKEQRRGLLKVIFRVLPVAILGVCLYPALRFIGVHLPRKPKLVRIYKQIPLAGFLIHKDFVIFAEQEEVWAVSRKCTHLGCHLNLSENEKLLICPCHQSKFSYEGQRLAGPAERDLKRFAVQKVSDAEGTGYVVTL